LKTTKTSDEISHLLSSFSLCYQFTGYLGCNHKNAAHGSFFVSNNDNRAADIAPDLCPLGKFGYDPRCREWYDTGQKLYKKERQPAYLTAPYQFAIDGQFAASATSPIVNPATSEYIGQTLIDFFPSRMRELFASLDEPVRFVITSDTGAEGDTVIGPGEFTGWEPAQIGDLLFLHEGKTSANRQEFENKILKRMKAGENGVEYFVRRTDDGQTETLKLAFAPVKARVLLPADPSDFSRGVIPSKLLVYSIGIAYGEDSIEEPWESIADHVYWNLDHLRTIYISVIVSVCILFAVFSCMVRLVYVIPPWC
jgi:hypothetical protein